MFGWFRDLINEHGSAVILRERVAALESQKADLLRQVARLEGENRDAKVEIDDLKKRLRDLEGPRYSATLI